MELQSYMDTVSEVHIGKQRHSFELQGDIYTVDILGQRVYELRSYRVAELPRC